MQQAGPRRTRPRRRRVGVAIAALVLVVLGVPLCFGLLGAVTGSTWRPPGVPVELTGGRQSELNSMRVTVWTVRHDAADDGTITAHVQLGGQDGRDAWLGEGDWLCDPAWGCVVATSLTAEPAVDEPAGDEQRAPGAPMGTVTLVYLPPPWLAAALVLLAGAALARSIGRRRRRAAQAGDAAPATVPSPTAGGPDVGGTA